MGGRAVFLDRDGVINQERDYVHRKEDFVFLPGVPEALGRFHELGWLTVLVTNQAGIAYGYYSPEDFLVLSAWMQGELAPFNAAFDGIFFCPHHPEKGQGEYLCSCPSRKPGPGMLLTAARRLDIDLPSSVMIGDRMGDVEAGRRAGCRMSYLVSTGKPLPDFPEGAPDFLRSSLADIAGELPRAGEPRLAAPVPPVLC